MESSENCALCKQTAPLRGSHILPSFAFKWLKDRSVTGHIRRTDVPNKRTQDGVKIPLLCDECEGLFSGFEREFTNRIFHPWHDGKTDLAYDKWFLKFSVSLSWRVLKHCYGLNKAAKYSDEQKRLASEAVVTWEKFLQNQIPHPGRFEQHLLILDVISETDVDGLPENINRYLSGAIDMDIIGSGKSMMTYAKLGKFIFFGIIQPSVDKWEGTKIHVNHGVVKPGRFVVPYGLLDIFKEKASHGLNAMRGISDAQFEKIDSASQENIEKFANSDQLKAMMADAEMFGMQAIIRKKN